MQELLAVFPALPEPNLSVTEPRAGLVGDAVADGQIEQIAFGTDACVFPHGENAKEFAVLVELGMTPLEAIQAATLSAIDLLGVDDRGVIEKGRLADLVAVKGNPLENIRTLENVLWVMKGGKVYKDSR